VLVIIYYVLFIIIIMILMIVDHLALLDCLLEFGFAVLDLDTDSPKSVIIHIHDIWACICHIPGHVYVTVLDLDKKSPKSVIHTYTSPYIYIYIYTQWPKYAPPYGMYIHICTCSQDVPTISVTVDCTFENACLVQEQDIVLCTKQVPCKSSMSLV
jgi:hypothetical protein